MKRDHEPEPLSQEKLDRLLRDRIERPLPKRFYKLVRVSAEADGFAIMLDGRPVRTPLKALLVLPNRALAEAIAAEWEAQSEVINPALMPVTRLANTAIDRVGPERERIIGEIMDFAGSDLTCYWAEAPLGLVERQQFHWGKALAWAAKSGASFASATGLIHRAQAPEALEAFSRLLRGANDHLLCGIHNLTTLTGSAILATAQSMGGLDPEEVWAAAHVDEDWQISQWGEDAEASARRAARRREFDATTGYMRMIS